MGDFSPKLEESMRMRGGRHYNGPKIHNAAPWLCPSCGTENTSPLEKGCPACLAGTGLQTPVRRGAPLVRKGATVQEQLQQLGRHATPVTVAYDFAGMEQRLLAAIQAQGTSGGLSLAEQRTVVEALGALLTLIEDDVIIPPPGILSVDGIRQLSERLATDQAFEETPDATPETPNSAFQQRPSTSRVGAVLVAGALSERPGGPEHLDPDHWGDEGRQDDPAGNGG